MTGEHQLNWLDPGISIESGVTQPIADATEVLDLLRTVIDGRRWLATAPFSSILFTINFVRGGNGRPSFTHRRDTLVVDTAVDAGELPSLDEDGYRWHFFDFALRTFDDIAQKFELPRPPLNMNLAGPGPVGIPASVGTPLSSGGEAAGIAAELAALEDDEVLVVARRPADAPQSTHDRRRSVESTLSTTLGTIRASAFVGDAYVWAVSIETP